VTHDQQEALVMSDRIVVINEGHVEQIDTPKMIYNAPATPFVLGFVGQALRLTGRVESIAGDTMVISTPLGNVRATGAIGVGSRVLIAARPESVELALGGVDHNCVTTTVRDVIFQGPRTSVLLDSPAGDSVAAEVSGVAPDVLTVGGRTAIRWPVAKTLVYRTE
jgi:ABC-type Fe3+/spermidine/putrescine transport system ATPase subunit